MPNESTLSVAAKLKSAQCPHDMAEQIACHPAAQTIPPGFWNFLLFAVQALGPQVWKVVLDWLNKQQPQPTP